MKTIFKRRRGSNNSLMRESSRKGSSTGAASKRSLRETLAASLNVTSSQALAVGVSLSSSRDGRSLAPSGRVRARANRSAIQESALENLTTGTCGLGFIGSSVPGDLQSCLENRLRARLDVNGSPEYELTWKKHSMKWGAPICALRGSKRRTSGKGFAGWPTARANDGSGSKIPPNRQGGNSLKQAALLTGWCSPTATDGSRGKLPPRSRDTGVPLSQQAALAGWNTPHCPRSNDSDYSASSYLDLQLGTRSKSSIARTENIGALNPDHSRWLMGFPVEWGYCGATAMQLSRHSSRNSSVRIAKSKRMKL